MFDANRNFSVRFENQYRLGEGSNEAEHESEQNRIYVAKLELLEDSELLCSRQWPSGGTTRKICGLKIGRN